MEEDVTETECIDRGALIIFEDGTAALYSGQFLRAHLDEADEVYTESQDL